MQTDDSGQLAATLMSWFRKPLRRWWYFLDFSIVVVGIVVTFMTGIWWLLFIPGYALIESLCVYIAGVLTDAIQEKDAEIDRLRRQLNALLSEIA